MNMFYKSGVEWSVRWKVELKQFEGMRRIPITMGFIVHLNGPHVTYRSAQYCLGEGVAFHEGLLYNAL